MMNIFKARLISALEQRSLSQSGLAAALGVSRSTVTGWIRYGKLPDAFLLHAICKELRCSADWLLGLDENVEKQAGGVRWIEQIPSYISGVQREQIEYGVRMFHHSTDDNWRMVRFALQAAFRSGAIRITDVQRNESLETQLKQHYPFLKEVVVADATRDNPLISTEIVTFLAAKEAVTQMIRPGAVGLGSGYTMLRLCEQTIPGIDPFSGTKWVPLLAFAPENTSDYSANTLARLMSIRHPGSQALYLPYEGDIPAGYHEALRSMQAIIVSVGGLEGAHLLSEFRSADYAAEAPYLRESYAGLPDKQRFGGELLRYLLDHDGSIISRDPAVRRQVDLDVLRYHSEVMGRVWIVAARRTKARAVLTCIRNRLANALVIDSEIARYLVEEGKR